MIGRRYNEGLHQAIEAKEGVKIAAESKTLATITFQNYFRMYKKLSGMTGTAKTEATEFTEIYGLNIVTVPTNRPNIRKDYPDAVYKTVNGKYKAVIEQVLECHKNGQPVLVGTVSVEKSETLAKMLQKYTRDFNVLNAKNHEREAEIVAQAGKKGAITIATNMAGRGTDIMLGGNAEFMAKAQMRREHFCENLLDPEKPQDADPNAVELLLTEADGHGDTTDEKILAVRKRFEELYAQYKPAISAEAEEVRKAGGLFIIGTERHESRRIDNQLRGRAGRQGDPGASRFYLSLEDDLMRLFGGDRVSSLMDTLKLDEDTPIENRMITSTLESAQKKLEGRNFEIRKNVLKYDDVMNQQREIIYGQRRKVLDGEDISNEMHNMLRENIDSSCKQFLAGDVKDEWDFGALRRHYQGWLTTDADFHSHCWPITTASPRRASPICSTTAECRSCRPRRCGTAHRSCVSWSASACSSAWTGCGWITSTTWTSCGRASPSVVTARRTPWWSTASRALTCSTRWWIPSGSPASRCC